MAFDATAISKAYGTLFTAITTELDKLWTAKKIDAETYATLLGQATSNLMVQVGDLMQKQEQVDADVELKEAQIAKIDAEIVLIGKQGTKADAEVTLLGTQDSELASNGLADRAVKTEQALDITAAKELKVQQKATETDKLVTAAVQRDMVDQQTSLYARQEEGFDDNKKLKLFEAQLDVFGMAWSSVGGFDAPANGTQEDALPAAFSEAEINQLYKDLFPASTITT